MANKREIMDITIKNNWNILETSRYQLVKEAEKENITLENAKFSLAKDVDEMATLSPATEDDEKLAKICFTLLLMLK